MPRSTTRATSIALIDGGPLSKKGDAIGESSALVVITPVSGVSGKGEPSVALIPTINFVFPTSITADPSAFCTKSVSIFISRN